jgi:hypothetical protein
MRLEIVEFQGPASAFINFWAKQHGTVSFKPCQIPWMPRSSLMMLAQLFIQTCSARLLLDNGNGFK